jgi:plastocyanin
MIMKHLPLLIAVCVVAALGLAACGGDDNQDTTTEPAATDTATTETTTTGAGGGETVEVSADPGGALEFEQRSLTAPTGSVTFEFANESSTPHDFVLEQDGNEVTKTDVITGDTATAEGTLEAGEYTYYCSVPGHRQAGMEGTLTAE